VFVLYVGCVDSKLINDFNKYYNDHNYCIFIIVEKQTRICFSLASTTQRRCFPNGVYNGEVLPYEVNSFFFCTKIPFFRTLDLRIRIKIYIFSFG
jgi:hypothetical protein